MSDYMGTGRHKPDDRGFLLGILGAAAVVIVVLVAALYVGGVFGGASSGTNGSLGPHKPAPTPTSSATTSTHVSGGVRAQTKTTTNTDIEDGPLTAVTRYWRDIADHDFSGAYGLVAPGAHYQDSESQFVNSERQSQITSASFSGAIASRSDATAVVTVGTLITNDAQYGCRNWTGFYSMANISGTWYIENASITPTACS